MLPLERANVLGRIAKILRQNVNELACKRLTGQRVESRVRPGCAVT